MYRVAYSCCYTLNIETMKKFIGISVLALLVGFSTATAQSTAQKAGKDVEKGAVKVGNKTAEIASKGKAAITDKVYKDKAGPNGETIYIDKHSKYYWVDKKGHKVPIAKNKLRTKR